MIPPTMAPVFDDFPFLVLPVGMLAASVETGEEPEGDEPESEELLGGSETVEGTDASVSGKPPADSAVTGSKPSPA